MMKIACGLLVWFISTLFVIYAFCLNTAAAVFSSAIKTSLQFTDLEVSYAVGAFIAGFALMQIPAGYLLDRFNTKLVVGFGVLLLALGNILISYADSLALFSFSNFIQGMGGSFAFIATAVLVSNWFSAQMFPILFGLTQTLSCVLAGIIHYAFMRELITHPWNVLYKYLALFGLILFVLTLLIVRSPNAEKVVEPLSLGSTLKKVCGNGQLWLCAIAAATSFGVLLAYAGFWYMDIEKFYAVSKDRAFILSAIIFTGIGIGTPLLGYVSNLLKSRKLVIHVTVVLGTMALLLGIYLPHYNFNNLILINIVSFLIGFFLSGSMLIYTIVSEISTDNTRGFALSVTNTFVFLFNTLLMFLPYWFITKLSQNFFTYLWVLPFSVLISILLLYFIKESYR
ncbi:MFS transporter [Legionella oakridgensis]|uniref:Sugar phosphate permease n=2 Tax=Legionella oakridgensis TaxID=29423 RepID=W0BE57_9GAMM|nr:MFS transporter [Legionella oakridgensis]AHE68155.1 sugar phosphate permease [Legionella oakridgensis ATCC 33761 = DSM 21215]ETO92367.1 sugar phosphate permease [Legionella oakridgensis RV-2-2007]KTD37282.1 major facilitator family transporter [Legionella oakridgensis]STY21122.1 major facilitator family transporter [Legionella longbeachae]